MTSTLLSRAVWALGAVAVLVSFHPAADDAQKLERIARGKDLAAASRAIQDLGELGAPGVPSLVGLAERAPAVIRVGALLQLGKSSEEKLDALLPLEKLLGAPRSVDGGDFAQAVQLVRWDAAQGTLRFAAETTLKDLLPRLGGEDVDIEEFEPACTLVAFGSIGVHDVAVVIERAAADRKRARSLADGYDALAVALGHGANIPERTPPVDALRELLAHADPAVRQTAALVLGAAGAAASAAAEDLAKLVADADRTVAARAVEALSAVGYDANAARELLAPLRAEKAPVGPHATRALAVLVQDDDEARAALLELAKDRDASVRALVASGLGRLAAPRATELETLGDLLGDRDAKVRIAAVTAVRQLEKLARPLAKEIDRRLAAEKLDNIVRMLEFAKQSISR